ncbi:NAD(P)/FAD-dependent oxidoreductase [Rhizobium halophytocola]|uniref:Sarcosine oxidase n=1 Tax=Rhizobium halophytocola TaxID=735519 RepID=A0ABS4E319_9HYPH|nr:FAD-dependent oxidoreductase [Rhizobium halophytocola]MBP1852345.1 sarcosine oxidase [Rhizobium halophytocola]
MSVDFKSIVVGRGMMGSAAAKYLARAGEGVALIGPLEPRDPKSHAGVFASHYDEARITRTIDPDPVWAELANRSIARYGDIARESGASFYHERGCLMVGPARGGSDPYVANICNAAEQLGVGAEVMQPEALRRQFPYLHFTERCEGVYERSDAGHVNPRRLVEAQAKLAYRAGARLIAETVTEVRQQDGHATVTTDSGNSYTAEQVLVAAGGFSIGQGLLPRPLPMTVYGRTIAFFEIKGKLLERLSTMPSLIHQPENPRDHVYLLPPVTYPDARVYLKIGGDPDDLVLGTEPEVRAWFRTGGRESVRDHLRRIAVDLIPDLAAVEPSMGACAVSFTPSGYPAIEFASSRIAVLTGGCGAAAKSSDEIGRLGAELLLGRNLADQGYGIAFSAGFC